jgi:mannose-6-phosphate isomerase-like protein (cupin superfamily)
MFSFLKAKEPPRTNNASNNPIIYEGGLSSLTFYAPDSHFIMTHRIPPTTTENGISIITPPFHYHIHQSEKFSLRSGTGDFYRGVDPEPFIRLSDAPGAPRTASIPAGQYHRFENASKTEDLVVDIHLTPEDYENEQKFFRNFFGYLDDCKKDKMEPSLFQLLVFLHSADTPLAIPLPWEWLGVIVSRVFLIAVASWGKFVLGYQDNYREYYDCGKSR